MVINWRIALSLSLSLLFLPAVCATRGRADSIAQLGSKGRIGIEAAGVEGRTCATLGLANGTLAKQIPVGDWRKSFNMGEILMEPLKK